MRLEKNISVSCRVSSAVMTAALTAICFTATCFCNSPVKGQVQTPASPAKQVVDQPPQQPVPNANQPYLLSSRFHLQMGTTKGYLVVRVDLAEGSYMYSLTQKGDAARPTKLTVAPSPKFRLLGDFSPDRAAEISMDNATRNQLEKHSSTVQFFAPIEVAPGTDLGRLAAEIVVDGQVCTSENFCMPIMGEKVAGKFAGYFQGKPAAPTSGDSTRSARVTPVDSGSSQLRR